MIIAIVGPTGVGKTKLSIELAKKYNGEIINADSTQVYKEINIGTAKIKDLEGIKHHLLNIKTLDEEYTVYEFQKDARLIIEDILKRNKNVIIAGGSGLYISALLYNYKFNEENKKIANEDISIDEMYKKLKEENINVDKNNRQRIERLYNKHIINNEPINLEQSKLLYSAHIIGLTTNRDNLYKRINNRVEEMLQEGLIEEVKHLYNLYPNSKQLKTTIGYKEIINYLDQNISLDYAIDKIKQNSRNYAKRQYTWFNNKMNVIWFETNYENFNITTKQVEEYISIKKRLP